jgi:hypothetical protein
MSLEMSLEELDTYCPAKHTQLYIHDVVASLHTLAMVPYPLDEMLQMTGQGISLSDIS